MWFVRADIPPLVRMSSAGSRGTLTASLDSLGVVFEAAIRGSFVRPRSISAFSEGLEVLLGPGILSGVARAGGVPPRLDAPLDRAVCWPELREDPGRPKSSSEVYWEKAMRAALFFGGVVASGKRVEKEDGKYETLGALMVWLNPGEWDPIMSIGFVARPAADIKPVASDSDPGLTSRSARSAPMATSLDVFLAFDALCGRFADAVVPCAMGSALDCVALRDSSLRCRESIACEWVLAPRAPADSARRASFGLEAALYGDASPEDKRTLWSTALMAISMDPVDENGEVGQDASLPARVGDWELDLLAARSGVLGWGIGTGPEATVGLEA